MKKQGISLIVLVITIIVIIILAVAIILSLNNLNVLEKAKRARFTSDFRSVQDGVNLYSVSRYDAATNKFSLPLKGYLTSIDKEVIANNVPTLKTKIDELSGGLDTANLAWIDSSSIGATLIKEKKEKGYILDVASGQIYDYVGDFFEDMRWHTLDGGVSEGTATPVIQGDIWDGWINLTLVYPSGATEKKWRLGTDGEVRADPMLMWQEYTGSIKIPLSRVKDVWIKYILDGKEVIIPPAGTLLVDIVPDKTGTTLVDKVNVSINYDETATTKEYKVGNSGWVTYTGPFTVTENCIIEARAKKTETIYNTDGTVLTTRTVTGTDMLYVGNIGIATIDTSLAAPTITRLAPTGSEKARVQVTYPAGAVKKVYKINYGIETDYTDVINITNWGTSVIAYYYDVNGKRSNATTIVINDTSSGQTPNNPGTYTPSGTYTPGSGTPPQPDPTDPNTSLVAAPTVNVSPTTTATEVQVSVGAPASANKVYIKLGRYGSYQEYTAPVTVRQNMEVYAYYVTYTGSKSKVGYNVVKNIKQTNKPYVYINASPYPWVGSYGANSVTVTIEYLDTTSIEYSEDGIVYKPYTGSFTVTKNETVYARAANSYGTTETSLDITNIGQLTPVIKPTNLSVNINVNPDPIYSTSRVAKAVVTIDYDSKATEKYYSIGKYGTLQTYTGAFEVTSNCTIYAYAKGTNAKGTAYKTIDNLLDGIANPVITSTPDNSMQGSKVSIGITYDKYATIKRYSIDGGFLKDYNSAFDVTTNGTVVYAYSENAAGQKSEATYTINNIVADPPVLLVDKGNYYILKLNYPPQSTGREYKWKKDGAWTSYKDAGIMLIKPQFKDQVVQNGTLVKVEDENGNLVTFTGDYYLIDIPISELFENISMRWDRVAAAAPQVILSTTDPAKQLTATISYDTAIITKQYKILKPGEVSADWQDYTGPITIDQNNTVIYARGMDEAEVWSAVGSKKITNIDETQPVIKLTADLITAQQKLAVKVAVTDDVAVGKVKWASGIQGESYFETSGTEVINNSIVNITGNGYYTFYAEDMVGNRQVYTLNVTNIDLTAPAIVMAVSPEDTVGLSATVTIDYGDSTIKQYKVGTSNLAWSNYTNSFTISSYTILANNWQNSDGTVTIYAKGKDSANNEITVTKKVVSLDLDKPTTPVISSNYGYPVLTSYGVILDGTTTITYDSRTDIDNYYSIDNGTTWSKYTGSFNMTSGTIIAKSVKKGSGLEVTISKSISMPSNALGTAAYDNNDGTTFDSGGGWKIVGSFYMPVDSSMRGKNIRLKWSTGSYESVMYINFLDVNNNVISTISATGDYTVTIPTNCTLIQYNANGYYTHLYELQTKNEPAFTAVNGYMTLTADPTKAITNPYQMVSISYYTTSVQRLYRIGTTGDWLNYNDQPVWVNQGQTIYAKGIDAYGKETRIISSLTANSTDAMPSVAYDKNDSTVFTGSGSYYMEVDSSMQGRNLRLRWWSGSASSYMALYFLDANKSVISTFGPVAQTSTDNILSIPSNCKWIKYYGNGYYTNLSEIQTRNEPTFATTNGYMLLTLDPAKAIRTPYQNVTINYFPTSVQRLYRIGTTGDWLNYNDQPIWLNQGQTIYAKGIDIYGTETRIVSSLTSNVGNAITDPAYDGDSGTSFGGSGGWKVTASFYMAVDSSMIGKTVRLQWWYGSGDSVMNFYFLDANYNVLGSQGRSSGDYTLTVPANCKWIRYNGNGYYTYFQEIQPVTLSDNYRGYVSVMTSNTAPSPFVASASSTAGSGYEAFRTFDNTLSRSAGWATAANDVSDGNAWLQIKLDTSIKVSKYYIIARNDGYPEQAPKSWILQGSNDGTTWTDLDSRSNQTGWSRAEVRWFDVSSYSSYQYYRLYVTANNGAGSDGNYYVTFDEFNIFQ